MASWIRRQRRGEHPLLARVALAKLGGKTGLAPVLAWFRTRRAWLDMLRHEVLDHPEEPPAYMDVLVTAARGHLPNLLRLLQGPSVRLRWAAAHALAQIDDATVRAKIRPWLASPRKKRRRLAGMILYQHARRELRLVPVVNLALFGKSRGALYQAALDYAQQGHRIPPAVRRVMCQTYCLSNYPDYTLAAHWLRKTHAWCGVNDYTALARSAVDVYARERAISCIGETDGRGLYRTSLPGRRRIAALGDALWDPHPDVRAMALQMLGQYRHLPARLAPALESRARRARGSERREALERLATLVGRRRHPPRALRARVLALIREGLASRDSSDRIRAIDAARSASASELTLTLSKLLHSEPDDQVAVHAAQWFVRQGVRPPRVAMQSLYRRAKLFRTEAVVALARLGHAAARADVRRLVAKQAGDLNDSDGQSLLATLVDLGDPMGLSGLDRQPVSMQAAVGTRRYLPTLLASLYPGASHVQTLIAALARLRDYRAVPALTQLLRSSPGDGYDPRPDAAVALMRIGDPAAVAALRVAAKSRNSELRDAAKHALHHLESPPSRRPQ